MKSMIKSLIASAMVAGLAAGAALAEDRQSAMEHKFDKAVEYYQQCPGATEEGFEKIRPYLKAFTDVDVMADMMADPEKFFAMIAVVNDPHVIHVMTSCSTEPVMWDTWMKGATDFPKMTSAMTKIMNPAAWMKWMMAPMNPKVWGSMMAHMNPEKYTAWGVAMANPTFYSPVTNLFDLEWYEPRLKWMADPKSYEPVYKLFLSSFTPAQPTGTQQ